MARLYDTSFKELVTHHFASLLPWLLPGVHGGEVVRLSEELPATLRRADLIVRSERDGMPPTLFMVECQCQQDADLPLDMLLRAALAHRQYRLPVETVLLAFTPQAALPDEYIFGGRNERTSRHVVTVRRVYDESAERALALEIDALLPWVTAMRPEDGDGAALLARVIERIIDRVAPDAQRTLMLDQAATFATLRLSRLQVQGIVRDVAQRRRYMLDPIRDFPWLRHGYEQGMATGMAQSVLAFLAARNITVDDKLREKILSCQDPARLNEWIARAATATTASEVVGDN
ncbi:MAG: hypothetical protein U1A78_38590 [Polyangia bacterium]